MNCKEAKQIKIDDIAHALGIAMEKKKGSEIWCLSPFRIEKTPSFKINLKRNTWIDFGETHNGEYLSGDGIKLVQLIKNYNTSEALKYLSSFSPNPNVMNFRVKKTDPAKHKIIRIKPVERIELIQYASKRMIPLSYLKRFCKELHYEQNGRTYYGIGFNNESNGWESNYEYNGKKYKRCFGRKDISIVNNDQGTVWVLEGFFDFLALLVLRKEFGVGNDSFLILNSVSQVKRASEFLKNHNRINLVLDNDKAGNEAVKYLNNRFNNNEDFSYRYQKYKDINDYLIALRR